ncbi:phage terminase large subunit [Microbaculum marinum]|uniref:Phage terminase large subunit n=1 Tax=Microbaculum marinum TaxID=1764581 RepID=A0AAW9RCG9_9HYPH
MAIPGLGRGAAADRAALRAQIELQRDHRLRELAERKLSEFTRQGWKYVDPAVYVDGWHVDAIGEHLEAVVRRQILRLIVNIPPRHMKSIGINVMMPAWIWAQDPDPLNEGHGRNVRPGTWMGPGVRFLSASYDIRLATRDNVKCRRVLESPWFKKNWPERVTFAADQNTKSYYENRQGGARFATSSKAGVTGEGGDIIIIDDPINVRDADSEAVREDVLEWWSESLPTRLNDQKTGVFIVVMQRVHERDLTGYILAKELGWDHLCLPARFESDHPTPVISSIGFKDPRKDGELLWPERFGQAEFDKLSLSLGTYATAGQLQQRPTPREGGMFKRHWFEVLPAAPAKAKRVRYWDLAGTVDKQGTDPDWTAGLRLSLDEDGFYYIEHVRRLREEAPEVEKAMKSTASQDGKRVRIGLPQDPGQAGKGQAKYIVRQLRGYIVSALRESGSKVRRAEPVASQAEAGNIKLIQDKEGDRWIEAFLDEISNFPFGAHDDQVDALSGAFTVLLDAPVSGGTTPIRGGY